MVCPITQGDHNKVHEAATATSADAELFGEATAQSRCQTLCTSKVN